MLDSIEEKIRALRVVRWLLAGCPLDRAVDAAAGKVGAWVVEDSYQLDVDVDRRVPSPTGPDAKRGAV